MFKKSNAKDVPSHLSTSPSCKSVYCLSSQVILPFQCLRWAYNPDVSDAATFLSGFYDGLIWAYNPDVSNAVQPL